MEFDEFRRELFAAAYSMQKALHVVLAPACQRHGLTLQQFHVLVELSHAPGQMPSRVSERTGILRTNFSGLCQRLEDQGLVDRRRSQQDGRAYELSVTPAGSALLEQVDQDVRRRYNAVVEQEPQETFDAILAGVRALEALAAKLGS